MIYPATPSVENTVKSFKNKNVDQDIRRGIKQRELIYILENGKNTWKVREVCQSQTVGTMPFDYTKLELSLK